MNVEEKNGEIYEEDKKVSFFLINNF